MHRKDPYLEPFRPLLDIYCRVMGYGSTNHMISFLHSECEEYKYTTIVCTLTEAAVSEMCSTVDAGRIKDTDTFADTYIASLLSSRSGLDIEACISLVYIVRMLAAQNYWNYGWDVDHYLYGEAPFVMPSDVEPIRLHLCPTNKRFTRYFQLLLQLAVSLNQMIQCIKTGDHSLPLDYYLGLPLLDVLFSPYSWQVINVYRPVKKILKVKDPCVRQIIGPQDPIPTLPKPKPVPFEALMAKQSQFVVHPTATFDAYVATDYGFASFEECEIDEQSLTDCEKVQHMINSFDCIDDELAVCEDTFLNFHMHDIDVSDPVSCIPESDVR